MPYRLLDWIDESRLNWDYLSANHAAIDLLRENPDKIYWNYLSRNPAAMDLLLENPDKINWDFLSELISVIPLDDEDLLERIKPTYHGNV